MWPIYALGIVFMGTPIIQRLALYSLLLTFYRSPCHASPDLPDALVEEPWLHDYPGEPPQHPLEVPWHDPTSRILLPERDHRQPCH